MAVQVYSKYISLTYELCYRWFEVYTKHIKLYISDNSAMLSSVDAQFTIVNVHSFCRSAVGAFSSNPFSSFSSGVKTYSFWQTRKKCEPEFSIVVSDGLFLSFLFVAIYSIQSILLSETKWLDTSSLFLLFVTTQVDWRATFTRTQIPKFCSYLYYTCQF